MLKSRAIYILRQLMQKKEGFFLPDLAFQLDIRPRTVRYELDEIDCFLTENGVPRLERKNKAGICFVGTEEQKAKIEKLLKNSGAYTRVLSQRERLFDIFYRLLTTKEYVTSYEIAEKIDVSRSTVINDLSKIKKHYPHRSAEIQTVAHYGVKITGDETDIRNSVVYFLQSYIKIEEAMRIIKNTSSGQGGKEDNPLFYIFRDISCEQVDSCIKKIECRTKKVYPDNIYIYLFFSLSVMMLRISKYSHGGKGGCEKESLFRGEERTLQLVIEDIEKTMKVPLADTDAVYIAQVLNYALHYENLAHKNINYIDQQVVMLEFIDYVGRKLDVEFIKEEILIDALNEYICTVLNNGAKTQAYKRDACSRFPELLINILPVVEEAIPIMEKGSGIRFSENGKEYIAFAFLEALQRQRSFSKQKKDVLVVCASGQLTSRLMNYWLNVMFEVNVIDIIPYNQLERYIQKTKTEVLIISTISLDVGQYVKVNPILTPEDVDILKKYLPTRVVDYDIAAAVMNVVSEHCRIKDYKLLYDDILNVLGLGEYKKHVEKPLLEEVIIPDNILLDAECADWREAVVTAGEMLMKNGYIQKEYIDDILETLSEKREYVVISRGIALPHARSFNHVNRIGMSLLRLKRPVYFGNRGNDPVEFVFCFCTTDNKSHLEALRQFNIMISDSSVMDALRMAEAKEDVVRIIKTLSRK